MNNQPYDEFQFCLKLWQKQGYCEFGGHTKCEKCAAPYVLWKMMTGQVLHGADCKRLTLYEWQELLRGKERSK